MKQVAIAAVACAALLTTSPGIRAQRQGGTPPPSFVSPEVATDNKITFRLYAPKAEAVRLTAGDIPNVGGAAALKKGDNGVWETTVGPVGGGAYRYTFNVDGVATADPRNPATSESNNTTWSLVVVPGSEISDLKDVPHGAVARVTYYSHSLKRFRRMHVYTPPGYEKGDAKYPVFYLLHGAGDSDNSWSTVGRAGFILDNLLAAGKAKPMLVVMPAGHTSVARAPGGGRQADEFSEDFVNDIKPYIEKNYRVKTGRANTAIAGLSMGGGQTLAIAFAHLGDFGYIGVFSSGVFGIVARGNQPASNQWEEGHQASLDNADLKKGLKLVWFGCGKEDFLVQTSNATVAMLKKHHFDVVSRESAGGHTWINWRDYLAEFAPQLFTEQ